MAINKFIYPLDLSGVTTANRVEEYHTLGVNEYRAFALKNGPFYPDNLVVRETNSQKPLVRGDDYECVYFIDSIAELTSGLEVCGVIVITNSNVSTDIVVNANIVGGPFAQSGEAISAAIDELELDNRNVYWKDIINKPDLFTPAPHLHDVGDIFGFEYIVSIIGEIRDAMMIGDNAQYTQLGERITELEKELTASIKSHTDRKDDPHNVTHTQVDTYSKEESDAAALAVGERFSDLEPRFSTISSSITSIKNAANSLTSAVESNAGITDANTKNITRIQLLIADLNSSFDSLTQQVNVNKNDITNLKLKDIALGNSITANTQKITALQQKDTEHDTSIANLQDKDEELTSSISENKKSQDSKNTELDESILALKQKDTSLSSEISTLRNRVTANENVIAAQGNVISTLGTRLSAAESKIEDQSSHYVEGTTSLSGLKSGFKYVVAMNGVASNRGNGSHTLVGAKVKDSSGTVLASVPDVSVNWPDGAPPHSAVLVITAPTDGKITVSLDGTVKKSYAFRI